MNHPAPTPDKIVLSIDPSALDFYFETVLPEIPEITRKGMRAVIMRGVEAYATQQVQRFKQALEEAMPKKRKQKTSTDTWTPGYNFAIDNATSALNSVYGEFTKEI